MQLDPRSSILVVDDDAETRDVVARILADDGHAVATAATSFECLDLLEAGAAFDLIIINIVMPPGTPHGLALGRMIRVKNRQQKVLYLTGQIQVIPKEELKDAKVLTKPIHAADLRDEVRRALARGALANGVVERARSLG